MSRKGQSITLSINDRDKAQLEAIALEHGKTWGDKPNISKLVEAIARRQLLIALNHDWSPERIAALMAARKALVDAGQIEDALAIAQLLLERSELTLPQRQELEQFVQHPSPAWRMMLERYCRQQRPFQLTYQDAAGHLGQFSIAYAQITRHERREYLDCWCEETDSSQELPELQHNRSLRLDRIPETTSITPLRVPWRHGLDQVEVELHLMGRLAFAYESKTGDRLVEWLAETPPTRRVLRNISSSFWFLREIRRYGPECKVIQPLALQSRLQEELQVWQSVYQKS
jgi:predicted DNA-binding transcriptional regulator YafY